MKRKAVVYRNGIRYWMSKGRAPDGRRRFKFWSSHPWPFYHGHVTTDDKQEAYKKFLEWIPPKEQDDDEKRRSA